MFKETTTNDIERRQRLSKEVEGHQKFQRASKDDCQRQRTPKGVKGRLPLRATTLRQMRSNCVK